VKIYHVTRKADFLLGELGTRNLVDAVVIADTPGQARALCRDLADGIDPYAEDWLKAANAQCEAIGYPTRWKKTGHVVCSNFDWAEE
jgi:hypothetical protein